METSDKTIFHKNLADYFADKPLYLDEPTQKKPNTRKLVEQPWQQTKGEMWDDAIYTLCNLVFIEARFRMGKSPEFIIDYRLLYKLLPEHLELVREEYEYEKRCAVWIEEIIKYARKYNEHREQFAKGISLTKSEPKLPKMFPSVEPWSNEQVEVECQRIITNPTRIDRLNAFEIFVTDQCYSITEHGKIPSFVLQQAFNFAPAGPVSNAAKSNIKECKDIILRRQWQSEAGYNPKPAMRFTLEGHNNDISCVSITPDGRIAASGSNDYDIRIWDLLNGECLHILKGHKSFVSSIAVTFDGRQAISISKLDGEIRIWDIKSGQCLETIGVIGNIIAITPDGRRAVTNGFDKEERDKVWVYDLINRKLLFRTVEGHINSIISLSVAANGSLAVSGGLGLDRISGCFKLWDIDTGICLWSQNEAIKCMTLSIDGRFAVSAGYEKIKVWNLESRNCQQVFEGYHGDVTSVVITNDGKRVFSSHRTRMGGHIENNIKVWDIATGKCIKTLWGHSGSVNCISISANGRLVVSGGRDATVRVWDIESCKSEIIPEAHSGDINAIVLAANNKHVVFNMKSNNPVHKIEGIKSQNVILVKNLYFAKTSDGKLAIFYIDNKLVVWDLEKYKFREINQDVWLKIQCIAISPDGKLVVTGSSDEILRIWDIVTGKCLHTLKGHKAYNNRTLYINSVAFTLDGRLAISGSEDETIKVWDIERGECLFTLRGHTLPVKKVIPTGFSNIIISTSSDDTIRVWDIEKALCLSTIQHKTRFGNDQIALIEDGSKLVSVCDDKVLQIWDLISGTCIHSLIGNFHRFSALETSPDGRLIIIGCDRTIQVWELKNARCITLLKLKFQISSIIFWGDLLLIIYDKDIDILRLENYRQEPSLISLWNIYNFSNKSLENQLSCQCEGCGNRFVAPKNISETILSLYKKKKNLQNLSSSTKLPINTRNDSHLFFECPNCAKHYKVSQSFIDNLHNNTNFMLFERENNLKEIFVEAENAFKKENWVDAYNLYLKLVQQGKFDANYMRYNMAICKLNGLFSDNPEIISEINILIQLLKDKDANDKAQIITDNLKVKLDTIKQKELAKKKAAAPWWKKMFGN